MARAGLVDADHDLPPEPGGHLAERRGQHFLVIGERVRPRVAWSQEHGQALAGIREPGAQCMEAVALRPRRRRSSLPELAVTRVAAMSMTSHPVRVFPAIARSRTHLLSRHGPHRAQRGDVVHPIFHRCIWTLKKSRPQSITKRRGRRWGSAEGHAVPGMVVHAVSNAAERTASTECSSNSSRWPNG
jgi:hypothetical protein